MYLSRSKNFQITWFICLFVIAVFLNSCAIFPAHKQVDKNREDHRLGKFTNLGPQLKSVNLQASSFVQDDNGNEYAYTIVRGRPGRLTGYDLREKAVVVDLPIENAEGAIDMVSSTDNWLYIGASNGHLYRTRAGSQKLEDLGLALSGTTEILDLVPGKDGEVFGGTYPTGKVFRYHQKDGFLDVAGQIFDGESYVRSLVYQHQTGKIYAGIGSHAHLIEINLETGKKTEILPSKYFDREFIYYMGIAEGVEGGDRILAWATNPKDRETLVFNLKTGFLEQSIMSLDADAVVKSQTSNDVYFTAENKLYKIDLTKIGQEPTFLANCYQAKDMRWSKDGTLHILTKYGEVKKYNLEFGMLSSEKIDVSPQPYGIQTLITGPDGNIWSSGYLHGGNSVFDPVKKQSTRYSGLGQAEGMLTFKNKIYFGVYPQARIYVYDNEKPWNSTGNNPKLIGNIETQDRPFAITGIENENKIYFGTIPAYGKIGGSLTEYDENADQLLRFDGVIEDQAITSLVYDGTSLLGGTTIFGGLGAKPIQEEGKLFGWDIKTNSKLFELVPVSGTMAITCLINGPDDKIWGMADGVVFVFDSKTRKVERTKKLFDIQKDPTHIWRVGFLQNHPSGEVYGTANGDFFRMDPKTMDFTILKQGVGLLTMDSDGVLYMRDTENLWSYDPEGK